MTDAVTIQSATSAKFERDSLGWQIPVYASDRDGIFANRYLIRSRLGRGGFGITFLADNIYLPGQPLCVIKKLAPQFTDPNLIADTYRQFELEALSLSRLGSHAQIPTLLDYFKIGTDLYLVEEYIPGLVLTQIVSQQRKFTESEVEEFLIQMLKLLEYIHSHHLIHRDIKPQNIILCQTDLRFVLVDFGAVKDIYPPTTVQQQAISSSQSIGTPGFAPPEQLANRAVYASDIYALAITCVYLLTGKEPSQFPTDPHTCELIWADTLEISIDLREIISKMMQISLPDRYQSATQVLTALENRSIRAKLRTYLDRKHAVAKSEHSGSLAYYPAVVHWALGIE
ncbi:serine/threonine-protein kinase [Chamaesiphon sp. VAR_48_metabat_135_sub]|uniref:serine/threonine-protein kinase n=1 Tax=Chamaesiphon sp. VAR_48_metabat_135_sub TaxID=2964699 RepID=UPI00286C3673|nr:serine/threonine-protein kinase [Chamaesiphon sp. VAR_48_metabat_135_sub]